MNPLEQRARDIKCDCDATDCKMFACLLDEIDRLRTENEELKEYKWKYEDLCT